MTEKANLAAVDMTSGFTYIGESYSSSLEKLTKYVVVPTTELRSEKMEKGPSRTREKSYLEKARSYYRVHVISEGAVWIDEGNRVAVHDLDNLDGDGE